jgi:hypothetical protein
MNIRRLGPQSLEEILIEIHYGEPGEQHNHNVVSIFANNGGLEYLRDIFQTLLDSDVSGKHFHIAKYDNVLEGNVYELTLGRK